MDWRTMRRHQDLQDQYIDLLNRYQKLQEEYIAVMNELLEFKKIGATIVAEYERMNDNARTETDP